MNLRSRARTGLLAFLAPLFALCVALACFAPAAFAQNLQPIPALSAHVVDTTGTLDAIQAKGLDEKLMAFEQAKGTQIAMLIVGSTQPEDIASYANRVGNQWKIGRKGIGDGGVALGVPPVAAGLLKSTDGGTEICASFWTLKFGLAS